MTTIRYISTVLSVCLMSYAACAANEGVPSYYQKTGKTTANQAAYSQYANQGYSKYVGTSGQKQVVGSNTTTYLVERQKTPDLSSLTAGGAAIMTPNGIAMPAEYDRGPSVYAGYTRRFADFQFKTGVNSVLEWDDMVFNELTVGGRWNFAVRNFDLFAYGEYKYGTMTHGGMSMDYDLEPYDSARPEEGIFTVSIGSESGTSHHMRFGFGAHHIWSLGGWKISPSIGYEIFKHKLKMSDHYYPNEGVYIPLMTESGNYVFGTDVNEDGQIKEYYVSVPLDNANDFANDENWFQVCMSPEDISVVDDSSQSYNTYGFISLGEALTTKTYEEAGLAGTTIPWGVVTGDCVIINGDGPSVVSGTTHIYNTTWSGFYVGLEIEKQLTLSDKLRFYAQFGLPKYSSEGIWPNRDDWQQHPSFTDEGSNGTYSYALEMEYDYRVSDRLQLALKVDTNCYHVGKVSGKLYLAEATVIQQQVNDAGELEYAITTEPARTETVTDSLKDATWQSFGLHLGLKYSF